MAKAKEIKPGEPFKLHNTVYSYSVNDKGEVVINIHSLSKVDKAFVPPTLDEVRAYFKEHGYSGADQFYKGYAAGDPPWTDSQGKPIRSWKQKAQQVWFKDGNKIAPSPSAESKGDDKAYTGMVF